MADLAAAPGTAVMRRLQVVWVSHFVPYPPIGGVFQRSFHLLRRLAQWHDVHLVAARHKHRVHQGAAASDAQAALAEVCTSVEMVDISHRTTRPRLLMTAGLSLLRGGSMTVRLYRDPALAGAIRDAVERRRPDVVHLDTLGLAPYRALAGSAATVLVHHNIESTMMERRVAFERNPFARAFYRREAAQLRRVEQQACPRFDANVVVSGQEAAILRAETGIGHADVVANGVDVDAFRPVQRAAGSTTLIFAGRMDQYANRDAITHFAATTWPLIRASRPDARLLIVGANPPPEVQALAAAGSGIEVTGFVDDIRPYFARAAAAVVPIRDGGGTRLKVLDALALGMPVVSTRFGVDGLDLVADRDYLVADEPRDFAAQVSRLFADPSLQARLAANARAMAEHRFGWDRIGFELAAVYQRVAEARHS